MISGDYDVFSKIFEKFDISRRMVLWVSFSNLTPRGNAKNDTFKLSSISLKEVIMQIKSWKTNFKSSFWWHNLEK